MTSQTPTTDLNLAALLAAPPRWGWELVPPSPAQLSPERNNPPMRRQPRLVPRAQAVGLRQAAVMLTVGAVGVLIMDSALGVFSVGGAHGAKAALVIIVNAVAAVVAFRAARVWGRSRPGGRTSTTSSEWVIPIVNAVITFFIPFLVLPVEAIAAWVRIGNGKRDLVPDPGDAQMVETEYNAAVAAWQERIASFEAAERRRFETVDVWYPVCVPANSRIVCAFGGSSVGWAAALATLGTSLIGAGQRIAIGDLSRRRTTGPLIDLATQLGCSAVVASIPASDSTVDLLAGLNWNDLTTLIVEVAHSEKQNPDESRRESQEDRAVLREIAECLQPGKKISISRLRDALRVVVGIDPGPTIEVDEFDRLSRLYNEVQRQHGGVMERVTQLERMLRELQILDSAPTEPSSTPAVQPGPAEFPLEVLGIDKLADELDNEYLVDVVFQLMLRRVRGGHLERDVLIILGADRINRGALESLATYAERENLKVLLFFEHLREDAIEIIGNGGAAALFMALPNHKEAQEASEFIGANYRWVESSHTRSMGESATQTWGSEQSESQSMSRGFPTGSSQGYTQSTGQSYNESFGKSNEYSTGESRVREAIIDVEVLQGLAATSAVWVEIRQQGGRFTANVDCHPQITFAPRVSSQPRALTQST